MKSLFISVLSAIAFFVIANVSYSETTTNENCCCSEMNCCSVDNCCETACCEMDCCAGGCCEGGVCESNCCDAPEGQGTGNVSDDDPTEVKKSVCVVSGEELGDDSIKLTYLGTEYEFCCAGCVKSFKNEPMSFVENIQCPVMGGAASKEQSAVYDGTKYYFCCEGCDAKFMENPEKYLNKEKSEK